VGATLFCIHIYELLLLCVVHLLLSVYLLQQEFLLLSGLFYEQALLRQ